MRALDPEFHALRTIQSSLRGALLIIAAEFMFACMGAGIHAAAELLDNTVIVFARNLVAIFLVAPLVLRAGYAQLRTRRPVLHLVRGLAGLGAMYCFFYAIAHMTLANAMLLKMSAPLFIPLVALIWLNEKFSGRTVVALAIGFGGVAVVLSPAASGLSPVALIALLGGLLAAIAKTAVRNLSRTEPTERIVFYFALTGGSVSFLPAFVNWPALSTDQYILLISIGVFATLGQLFLTRGMACAPAARLAPFTYFSVIFAAALGWLFWREPVTLATWLGSLLVLSSGVLVARKPPSTAAPDPVLPVPLLSAATPARSGTER